MKKSKSVTKITKVKVPLSFGERMKMLRQAKKEIREEQQAQKDAALQQAEATIQIGQAHYIMTPTNSPTSPTAFEPHGTVILKGISNNQNLINRAIDKIREQTQGV